MPVDTYNLQITVQHRLLFRMPLLNTLQLVANTLLQRRPSILTAPFLQQGELLAVVGRDTQLRLVGEAVPKLTLWIQLPQDGEYVVHVAVLSPRL